MRMPGQQQVNDGVSEAAGSKMRRVGQDAIGVQASSRGHLAGTRVPGRSWLTFHISLTKPQPWRPGGRGPLRIAERNRQVGVYFQKRRGGAEACSQSQPEEESLFGATSPCPGSTGRTSFHPAAIELPPSNASRNL